MKRQGQDVLTLDLSANPDIVSAVVLSKKTAYTVAFAAETHDLLHHAENKLRTKKVDMVIANQVGHGQGFDVDDNQAMILTKTDSIELPSNHKVRLAGQIIAILAEKLQH